MSEFCANRDMFGAYVKIPTDRSGALHVYKVVSRSESNSYCDVPIRCGSMPVTHGEIVPILNVIHCGIDETKVVRVALKDCVLEKNDPLTLKQLRKMGGEPGWRSEAQCYGIVKVEKIGRWANKPFFVGAWHSNGLATNFEWDIEKRGLDDIPTQAGGGSHAAMRNCTYTDQQGTKHKALLHGFFQRSTVVEPSPMVGGHPGGVVAYPVAVIELEDGKILDVPVSMVQLAQATASMNLTEAQKS